MTGPAPDRAPDRDATTLRRFLDIALAVAAERRTEPVLRVILDSARELTGARYAAVGVPDGDGGFATFLTSGVDAETWAAIGALPRQHGMLAVLLRDPATVRLADIRQDPRFAGWPRGHPDMRAFLGVPIIAGGEILAELYLADKTAARGAAGPAAAGDPGDPGDECFDDADQRLVEMLAAHAALAIANAQRLESTRELTLAQERTRMARDLHDSVTQTLFSLTLAAESAATLVGADDDRLRGVIDRVQELSGEALREMRDLVGTMRPADIDRDGLAVALQRRVDLMRRVHDVPIGLTVEGGDEPQGAAQRELLLVASEALANALAHAGAGAVQVRLELLDGVRLTVADDGAGFDPAAAASTPGMGLVSMSERVQALGGRISIESAPGAGTTVRVELDGD